MRLRGNAPLFIYFVDLVGFIASASSQVFSVIPDPACAPWDYLRSTEEFDSEESELFGRLRRAPGVCQAMSEEGWIAHWQMVGLNCLVLVRISIKLNT